jgi:hypothetical protein
VSVPSATAREPNLREPAGASVGKLSAWLGVIGFLITLNYVLNYTVSESEQDKQTALFKYSTAIGSAFIYAVMLAVMLAIAGSHRNLLALRSPRSWLNALGVLVVALFASYIAIAIIDHFLHGGREQGLVPKRWQHSDLGPYLANWLVVAGVAPFVEELTFRGLGYSLLVRRIGSTFTIAVIGILFAASHGFLQALPELAVLGCVLAWLRSRFDSVYPGMIVHATFNSIALAAVFWTTTGK